MDNYMLLPIVIEALAVLLLIGVLFYKSKHLSRLADEVSRVKKDEQTQEELQKRHDEFTAMLVHEMRSPLSVIKGASDLVLKEANNLSSEQISKLLGQIHSSSDGLLTIVNDILDVSKMEAGRFEIDKNFGDINALIEDEINYYSSLSEIKKLTIEPNLNKSIPHFNFDALRIKQVMNNLLSNAIKFTPEHGKIAIFTSSTDQEVRIEVADTGKGVKKEVRDLLFQEFSQTHNNADILEKGTGLGLVVAQGIVEAHGGSIWYEDNHPKGAKFAFTLPLK